jgi:hypothetical protein
LSGWAAFLLTIGGVLQILGVVGVVVELVTIRRRLAGRDLGLFVPTLTMPTWRQSERAGMPTNTERLAVKFDAVCSDMAALGDR